MNKEKFEALLPFIITALLQKIIEQMRVPQEEAFFRLYGSKLYYLLDNEKTKIWYYSTDKLFQLFEEEMNTGNFELTEY